MSKIGKLLLEKLKESFLSVAPITAIVIILNFFVPLDTWTLIGFLVGAVMLIIGMALFTLGADLSTMKVGEEVGNYVTKQRKVFLLVIVSFILGFISTIAEPDLLVLANQFPSIDTWVLIICVALGVGLFLTIAILRVVFKVKLIYLLIISYVIIFIIASLSDPTFVPVAFDSGGVTTGPITVPIIMAFGLGVAMARGDRSSKDDSFGYVALCSVGPILTVLLLGFFNEPQIDMSEAADQITSFSEFMHEFGLELISMVGEVALALLAIIVFIAIFQIFIFKDKKKHIIKTGIGMLYTFIGLVIFLTGANIGFLPVGSFIGETIASADYAWALIPLGMLMGFFVVMAEPAVHVLNKQVEEVTSGSISKNMMLFTLAIGVAISIGLAMMRIIFDISIWWIIIPGYAIALILAFFVPKIFTSIAFDSGGVASGPMTATFLLPLASGACAAIVEKTSGLTSQQQINMQLSNGFGIVALVALTPLIVIQILGLIYQIKFKIKFSRLEPIKEAIIEFDYEILEVAS